MIGKTFFQIKSGQNDEFLFDGVENIVGKGKNAGYQYFVLFPQWFSKAFS